MVQAERTKLERMIQYKAVSWAYLVVVLGLAGLNFYEVFAKEGKLPVSNLVLLAGLLTQAVAVLILRHRSTAGDEEYKAYPLWKTFAWIFRHQRSHRRCRRRNCDCGAGV